MEVMSIDYEKRMRIPLCGHCDLPLYSRDGLLLVKGYRRVVIGQRGPYVEMLQRNVIRAHFHIPEEEKYRLKSHAVYYIEFRSICPSRVKAYLQRKPVDYEDYRIDCWYIAPADLCTACGQRALAPPPSSQLPLISGTEL
jgi:hypothetical protein